MKTYIEEIALETYRLETQIPGLNTIFSVYFIKEKSTVIIEPGPAAIIPAIQNVIKEQKFNNPDYIIPTHIHLDDGGALGSLIQLFPQAKAVVNPRAVEHVIDPSRLIRSTKMAFGEDFEAIYGKIIPVPEPKLKIVQDNETISIGSRKLLFIHTPGHAPHHIAIFDTKTEGLFCGEALGLIYSAGAPPLPAVAPPSFDPEVYLNNMMRLRELKPRLLFYSHGGIGNEPEKLISNVIENTKTIGDAILRAINHEATEEAVIQNIGNYVKDHFGVKLDDYELGSNVRAFTYILRNKGSAHNC